MIEFQPIPSVSGAGYTALSIREPGEWFDNPGYHPFIGGCGIGDFKTFQKAQAYLLEDAMEYCDRQIAEAQKVIKHYRKERKRLQEKGLEEKYRGPER